MKYGFDKIAVALAAFVGAAMVAGSAHSQTARVALETYEEGRCGKS